MHLTPREKDKLLISMAAAVARRRLERGVKLNHPEAIALITDFVVDNHNASTAVVVFETASKQLFTVSVPGNDVRSLHFSTGFEILEGGILKLQTSQAVNVAVTYVEVYVPLGSKIHCTIGADVTTQSCVTDKPVPPLFEPRTSNVQGPSARSVTTS